MASFVSLQAELTNKIDWSSLMDFYLSKALFNEKFNALFIILLENEKKKIYLISQFNFIFRY